MKKKRFKENFTCFKLQSEYMKSIFTRVLFGGFFAIFVKNNPRKNITKKHIREIWCARNVRENIFKKWKWMAKSWEWYSDISGFSLAKKQNSYKTYHFFMLCDRSAICVKYCELIICEIKFAWKIVRKWKGIAYLVFKRWCI